MQKSEEESVGFGGTRQQGNEKRAQMFVVFPLKKYNNVNYEFILILLHDGSCHHKQLKLKNAILKLARK